MDYRPWGFVKSSDKTEPRAYTQDAFTCPRSLISKNCDSISRLSTEPLCLLSVAALPP